MAENAGWADAVKTGVSSVAAVVSGYGPNDQKKAVSAAKKAGKAAQKNAEKLYPKWSVKGTKDMAKNEGYNSKAEWDRARAQAGQDAYQAAYDEVWAIYTKAKDAEINATNFQSSQEYLDHELAMQQSQSEALAAAAEIDMKSAGKGCMGISALLIIGGGSLTYIIYELINLI